MRRRQRPAGYRFGSWLLLWAAAAVFVAGFGFATGHPQAHFSWRDSMMSDLGNTTCGPRADRLVCSPAHGWFNTAQVGAGVLLLGAAARGAVRWWEHLVLLALGCLGAGLVVLGLVPADVSGDVHMAGAVLALPVAGAAVMAAGLLPPGGAAAGSADACPATPGHRWLRALTGGTALLVSAVHLLPGGLPLSRGMAEGVAVLALLLFLAAEGWRLRGTRPAAA